MSRSTMTRQHFQLIAEIIREARERTGANQYDTRTAAARAAGAAEALEELAKDFADRLASTNAGFRSEQFLAACDPATEYKPRKRGSNQHSSRAVASRMIEDAISDDRAGG